MAEFTDTKGDRWGVAVTYGDVQRVKTECGLDLTALFDEDMKSLARLHSDFGLMVSVAFCLCKEQAAGREVSAEGFAARMGGDTLGQVADAIVEATIDFFPDASRRETMRQLVARLKKMADLTLTKIAPAGMKRIDAEFAKIEAMPPEELLSDSFGSASGSSGSSPGDALSGS